MESFEDAWRRTLYGPGGFYASGRGAGEDFRTSASQHPAALAEVVAGILGRLHARLGGTLDVVDVGAADGRLLRAVETAADVPVRCAAVEVGDELPTGVRGLLMAHELLDVVPCPLVADGRTVLADGSLGTAAPAEQVAWLDRWWGPLPPGVVAEVGTTRDAVWADLVGRVEVGAALAVDYVATGPSTLVGFAGGRLVPPRLDGSTDVTSHVHLRSCAEAAGGPWVLRTQREVVPPAGPGGGIADLARATAVADLRRPGGLGDFGWLLHGVGVDPAGLLQGEVGDARGFWAQEC